MWRVDVEPVESVLATICIAYQYLKDCCNNTRNKESTRKVKHFMIELKKYYHLFYVPTYSKWLIPSFKKKFLLVFFHMIRQLPSITYSSKDTAWHLLWAHERLWTNSQLLQHRVAPPLPAIHQMLWWCANLAISSERWLIYCLLKVLTDLGKVHWDWHLTRRRELVTTVCSETFSVVALQKCLLCSSSWHCIWDLCISFASCTFKHAQTS